MPGHFPSSPTTRISIVLSVLSRSLAIAAVVLATLLLPGGLAMAENHFLASLTVSEEYNDNIFLAPRGCTPPCADTSKVEFDFITKALPAVSMTYRAPLWDWDVSLAYNYWYYALSGFHNDKSFDASLTNETRLVRDLLFFAVRDTYNRVSLDITQDYTKQSTFVNQSDQNFLSATPYITLHVDDRTTVNAGYEYQNIWYKEPEVVNSEVTGTLPVQAAGTAINKVNHITHAEMVRSLSSQMTMTLSAIYTKDENKIENYDMSTLEGGLRYEYLDGSSLIGKFGYIWLHPAIQDSSTQPYGKIAFTHQFPKFLFNFESGLIYPEDPQHIVTREDFFTAKISRSVERTTFGVTASLEEYRNPLKGKHLETSSYIISGTISHAVSTKSKLIADLTVQRLEDNVLDTYTDVYLSGLRYEYRAWERTILALEYRYTNSYSPSNYYADYTNNRFIFEVKRDF